MTTTILLCDNTMWENPQATYIWFPRFLPTKLCFSESHSGAARTPLATRAKKAFLTCVPKKDEENQFHHFITIMIVYNVNIELSLKLNISYWWHTFCTTVASFAFYLVLPFVFVFLREGIHPWLKLYTSKGSDVLGLQFNRFMTTALQTMRLTTAEH